jgi:hypothetical protein
MLAQGNSTMTKKSDKCTPKQQYHDQKQRTAINTHTGIAHRMTLKDYLGSLNIPNQYKVTNILHLFESEIPKLNLNRLHTGIESMTSMDDPPSDPPLRMAFLAATNDFLESRHLGIGRNSSSVVTARINGQGDTAPVHKSMTTPTRSSYVSQP